jgi:hypothetical protein
MQYFFYKNEYEKFAVLFVFQYLWSFRCSVIDGSSVLTVNRASMKPAKCIYSSFISTQNKEIENGKKIKQQHSFESN